MSRQAMFTDIIEAECRLDGLLPERRPEQNTTPELRTAALAWSKAVWEQAERSGPMPLSDEQASNGLRLARCPVFVCGVHRSGTTLVRDLLDGHPDLVVLPSEGTYYTNLAPKLKVLPESQQANYLGEEWLRRLANPINQPPYWLLGRSSDAGSPYVDFARYVMGWWRVVPRKGGGQWRHTVIILAYASCTDKLASKLWVDKTPTNERFLERIWQEFPQARVVQVIRDPVATLASRKKMAPFFPIRSALIDLKASFRIAGEQSVHDDPRFLLIHYEALCRDPARITERLATFLQIGIDEALRQPTVAGRPARANSSFSKEAVSGQILNWDRHPETGVLSRAELQLLHAYLGELPGRLNYPVVRVGIFHETYLRLKYRLRE